MPLHRKSSCNRRTQKLSQYLMLVNACEKAETFTTTARFYTLLVELSDSIGPRRFSMVLATR